jgi:hypothetical protein
MKVLNFWDENIKVVDGHYELPIPRKQNVCVPDNQELALSRLRSLKCSLDKRGVYSRYDAEVQKLLNKGYAECVPESASQNEKIWYLPHHTDMKKPKKLRIVYDCAAQYYDESLHDKCRQGPDLNNKLMHVLLRFRQHEYAIMADVEAMYYQVRVSEKDRDALRFLWFDRQGKVGRTLLDQEVEDDFVNDVIRRSFYVDDCLRSLTSIEEVEKVIKNVKQVLHKGGFKLTKFVANDRQVLDMIDEEDRAKEVKEFHEEVRSEVLVVRWDVNSDSFSVVVDVQFRK